MSTYGWTRSSRCAAGDCVEVCHEDGEVLVRDSKLGEQSPILRFTVDEWVAFCAGVNNGDFTPGPEAELRNQSLADAGVKPVYERPGTDS